MRLRIASGSILALIAATAIAAQAALTSGSLLNGTITDNYSSNHASVGQSVTLSNVTSNDGSGSVTGGTLYGHVSAVQAASQGHPGKISFVFTRLVTGAGSTYYVDTTVTQMKSTTKNNTLKEVGGGLAGMLVGNMIGKSVFHTGAGGLLGAAGGFLLAKNNKENVNVPKGSIIQVRLNSVTRRQTH
ncbi:MAG: hypothetical protein M3R51_08315 [Candidatus Eremiobacteraeota bacterium]|nr:hypothetical protein [Candidatus Eremiobacteraeota bacterium]